MLPEGKEHTILCRSPAETKYLITWVANGAPIYDDHLIFTVGEERQLTGGEKGRNVTFIPTPDVNSTSLKCAVIDLNDYTNSFEPLNLTIIIQGKSTKIYIYWTYKHTELGIPFFCRFSICP